MAQECDTDERAECAILLQKTDVAEELDRIFPFRVLIHFKNRGEIFGRKLGFILQEIQGENKRSGKKQVKSCNPAILEMKLCLGKKREKSKCW
ncbi:MAG: hypothetical protein CM15mP58_23310 [Burkholderiaceae bacterium]|nr:MAG: hypothetical protein CM15mP58_23310 [Burkholderiaceae bacterium]